jgi:UDP-N-acetyl-D-mannosaminuronate dehydrogenase
VENTGFYILEYKPKLTIIHSSVTPGTTALLAAFNGGVIHSPVRGRQPHLAKEMFSYPKYIGGKDTELLDIAAEFFKACNWPVVRIDNPTSTELIKLLSNVHMGLEIAWRQEVSRILTQFKVDEEDYVHWEQTYHVGYILNNQTHLIRPQ